MRRSAKRGTGAENAGKTGQIPQTRSFGSDLRSGGARQASLKIFAQVRSLKCKGNRRTQIPGFGSAAAILSFEAESMHAAPVDFDGNGVRELDLPARSGISCRQIIQNGAVQKVTAHSRKVGWGASRAGLFDHAFDRPEATLPRHRIQDAVGPDHFRGHFHRSREIAAAFGVGLNHLFEAWRPACDHIIGQNHGEGAIANRVSGAPDGMT